MTLDRRRLVISAAGLAVGGMASVRLLPEKMLLRDRRAPRSRVAVLSAEQYSERLASFCRETGKRLLRNELTPIIGDRAHVSLQ